MSSNTRDWAIAAVIAGVVIGLFVWLWSNDGTVEARVCAIDETTWIKHGAFNVETTEGEFHVTKMTLFGDFPEPDELRKELKVGKMVEISYQESSYHRSTIHAVKPLPDDPSIKCPS